MAAAAKSLQSCPTLCDPIDGSLLGSLAPGILQARTLEWVAISFSNAWKWKVKVKLLSCVRLLRPRGLQPTRLLHPWDFPGKSTGVGCHRLLPLKQQEETNEWYIFSPSVYKFKKEISLKILCCHNDNCFYLKLTILKSWVNQCIFLMEMFVLSYINVLCIYPRFCLQVGSA